MVDYNKLCKKFPVKKSTVAKKNKSAEAKAIALEYERKKAELGVGLPLMKRGFPYYMVIIIGMLIIGGLVSAAIFKRGGIDMSDKKMEMAQNSIRNLAIGLGRYCYHTGTFPTTEQGLEQLTKTRVKMRGWVGPYIKEIKNDPWGNPYVYQHQGEDKFPALYSFGPDGKEATQDDVIVKPEDFDEPFRDERWTKKWVPWHLRDIMVAFSDEEKAMLERKVAVVLEQNNKLDGEFELSGRWSFNTELMPESVYAYLPHDWMSKASVFHAPGLKGRYLRDYEFSEDYRGKYVALRVSAVKGLLSMYINGRQVTLENLGPLGFIADISDLIEYGKRNTIVMDVAASADSPAAGIVGAVSLIVDNRSEYNVYGSTKISILKVDSENAKLRVDWKKARHDGANLSIVNESEDYNLLNPSLWTLQKPRICNGYLTGRYAMRMIEPYSSTTLLLNQIHVDVCAVRVSLGSNILGYAICKEEIKKQLSMLKDAGVNTVVFDTVPAKVYSDLCDKIGLISMDEAQVKAFGLDDSRFIDARNGITQEVVALASSAFKPDSNTVLLTPHWNWSDGQKVILKCYTDGDEVEFLINGDSKGLAKKIAPNIFEMELDYVSGIVKAFVRKHGRYYAEAILKTPCPPKALRFEPIDTDLPDGEVIIADVVLTDDFGVQIVDKSIDANFSVEGPGEIIACCSGKNVGVINGNIAKCTLDGGKALLAIRRGEGSGQALRVWARADKLRSGMVIIPRKVK